MASSADARPRLRVCIIAKATPFIWVHHYVKAFRAVCEVVTVGSALIEDDLKLANRAHLSHLVVRNDIDRDVDNVGALVEALPEGWRPDLIVSLQSGVPQVENLDWVGCPTAYISVDTWHDFAEMLHARPYDFVFAAQREFAAHFAATGCAHAHWLPLACDPDVHRPVECRRDYDVAFVGSSDRSVHAQRIHRLEQLAEHFSIFADTALGGDDMARAYARGQVAFNSSVAQDVNMRVFETLAMEVPLLTNRDADVNGLLDLFRDGEHLIAYDDSDLVARAGELLRDDGARRRLAEHGRAEVLARHTYAHRVETILSAISEKVDWSAARERPLMRGHGSIIDYVPTVPGRVAVYGMCAGVPTEALLRAGAEDIVEVRFAAAHSRDDSASSGGCFDTVVSVSAPDAPTAHDRIADAWALLRAGGTLVAGLSQEDMRALDPSAESGSVLASVRGLGFVVLRMELLGARDAKDVAAFVVARKQVRTLKDVAREVFSRNAIPGLSLEETLALVP